MKKTTTLWGRTLGLLGALGVGGVAAPSLANPEFAASYDARSMAMGATGVASSHGVTGSFHNPAALNSLNTLDVSLTLSPYVSQGSATIRSSAGTAAKFDGQTELSPFAFFGAGIRLHDRVSLGVTALMLNTAGARYANVPLAITGEPTLSRLPTLGSFNGFTATYELRIPVAVKLADWLDVGVAWRPTFANRIAHIKVRDTEIAHESLMGQSFAGVQAGVLVKPHRTVQFGLNYRSRADVVIKGDKVLDLGSVGGPSLSTPDTATVSVPHHFSAGVLVSLLKERLNFAGDFKYYMFGDSARAAGVNQIDAMSGNIGAEWFVASFLPIRAGYRIGRSSTPKTAASALSVPPGIEQAGSLGVGLHLRQVDVDIMGGYGQGGSNIRESNPAGVYSAHTISLSASATVHI